MAGTLIQDVRYSSRMLLKKPAFTAVAVIALALGIGANSAIFSVVNAVLLKPLPYREPDRLVYVYRTQPPILTGPISRPDFFEWQSRQEGFQNIAGYYYNTFNLTGVDEAERVNGVRVTDTFFPLFGVSPAQGRFLLPADDQADSNRVTVISYGLWQRRFGSSHDLIGKSITLNGDSYTVVGVAPPGFGFPGRTEIWVPALLGVDKRQRGNNFVQVIARLKDGVTPEQAQAQMNQITASLAEQYPQHDTNLRATVTPLLEAQVKNVRGVLLILLGAVAFVLLIACANVANLQLARATARQKEIAIRSALGANRGQIVRQLLTESLLLALIGGALGIALAAWGVRALVALAPSNIPRLAGVTLDLRVLGFTLLISVLTGIIFGLAPALQVSKTDLNDTLKEGARGDSAGGAARERLRKALIVSEIALSLVLLVSAGLLIGSIRRLTEVSPGFDTQNLLTANLSFPRKPAAADDDTDAGIIRQTQEADNFLSRVQQKLASVPGVVAVGSINDLPVTGDSSVNGSFDIEGQPPFTPGEEPVAEFREITPDYFSAIGIPLLKGRFLTVHDDLRSSLVVLINETMAKRFFPAGDPIGKRLLVLDGKPKEIIGVVGDARQWGLDRPADPEIYFPYAQTPPMGNTTLVVRAQSDPSNLANAVRLTVREVNPDAPVFKIETMTSVLADSTSQRRFNMVLMTVFAALALVLAAVGLYGVMSYSVTQRTREMGIRMALGAQQKDVLKLVVRQGMAMTLIGVATGVVAALAFTRLLASLLYGVSAADPITYAGVALVLTVVALAASLVPARRATKVDPTMALRYE